MAQEHGDTPSSKSGHEGHNHAVPTDFSRAFAIGIILNLSFVIIQLGVGFWIYKPQGFSTVPVHQMLGPNT